MPKSAIRRMARKKMPKKKKAKVSPVVKTYVKKALKRNIESKEFCYATSSDTLKGVMASYNLNYHAVTRGTGDQQFLGDGYHMVAIQANFTLTNADFSPGLVKYAQQPVEWIIGIIRSKIFKTTTSLTADEVFDANFSPNSWFTAFRDSDKCRWLVKRRVTIYPKSSDSSDQYSNTKSVSLYCRPDHHFRYRDFGVSTEGTAGNYYAVAIPFVPYDNPIIIKLAYQIATRVTFKDA